MMARRADERSVVRLWQLGVVAAALGAAFVPIPPSVVERLYAGSYRALQSRLTSLSNFTSFALLDVLIVATAAGWIGLAVHDFTRGQDRLRAVLRVAARTIVWSAGGYLAFLLL